MIFFNDHKGTIVMKKLLSGFIISSVIIAAFAIKGSAISLANTIQSAAPLTLSQIEEHIKHGTPDSAIAIEIQQRGLAFKPNANQLARLKRLHAGTETLKALRARLKKIPPPPQPIPPANKVIILVANFDGPNPQEYRVTDYILHQLRDATRKYSDISVEALGQPITELQGSKVARAIGTERKANIVLWGWYGPTPEMVSISVNFEVLRKPRGLTLSENPKPETRLLSELTKFKIQTRLSEEMTYLTLLTTGLARYESKDYKGAIDQFTTALEQQGVPDKMINPAAIYFYKAGAHYYKTGANEIDLAIADLTMAIKIKPDFVQAFNNRGFLYDERGEYDRAIADYDKAIEINADDAEVYNNRGCTYDKKGEYDRAIADYNRAIEFDPKLVEAYNNRGVTYSKQGEYDRAIADYNRAIEINPKYAEVYYNRGCNYNDKGEHDRAIADYNKAIECNPKYSDAYYNRGNTYIKKAEYDRAMADYSKAIEFNPKLVEAYINRGNIYSKQGKYDLAISDYSKAIDINPKFANAYYNRANVYLHKGEHDRAISDFKSVLEMTDDSKLRQFAQQKLQGLGVK